MISEILTTIMAFLAPTPDVAMSFGPLGAMVAASVVGGLMSSRSQASAAKSAAKSQTQASNAGILAQTEASNKALAEQQRQFDKIQQLLAPYVSAGTSPLAGQLNLIGMNGAPAQQQAIEGLQQGPEYGALVSAGENAILQNASATGGLRGGNVQDALSRLRPEILSGLINRQYDRLGGITGMGQASAAGQAGFGAQYGQNVSNTLMGTASNIAGLQGQIGAAQAGGALAQGQARSNLFSDLSGAVGMYAGLGGTFGGGGSPLTSPRPAVRPF